MGLKRESGKERESGKRRSEKKLLINWVEKESEGGEFKFCTLNDSFCIVSLTQ